MLVYTPTDDANTAVATVLKEIELVQGAVWRGVGRAN